jgi:hypothetical protein
MSINKDENMINTIEIKPSVAINDELLMTLQDAVEYLGINRRTLEKWLGKYYMDTRKFTFEDKERLIEKQWIDDLCDGKFHASGRSRAPRNPGFQWKQYGKKEKDKTWYEEKPERKENVKNEDPDENSLETLSMNEVPDKQIIPLNSQLAQLITSIKDLKGEQISPIQSKQKRIYKWKRLEVIVSLALVLGLFVGFIVIKYKLSSFGDI